MFYTVQECYGVQIDKVVEEIVEKLNVKLFREAVFMVLGGFVVLGAVGRRDGVGNVVSGRNGVCVDHEHFARLFAEQRRLRGE